MSETQKLNKDERILVIKLSALGDLILCFSAFATLRAAYPKARLALLTMPAWVSFAKSMPWFDEIIVDTRPKATDVIGWKKLITTVKSFAPTRVYDFQGKFRQTILYAALGGPLGVIWSGAAPFCKYPRLWPPRKGMHYTDFVAAQMERAGFSSLVKPDVTWFDAPLDGINLPERYVLLIPGCAPTRPYKRWPAAHYAALAKKLEADGLACVAIGTKAEAEALDELKRLAPSVLNLCGKTSLYQVASIARHSVGVVGNDTGPSHIAAAVGAPTVALMSGAVDPDWSCPKGTRSVYRQGIPIEALSVEEVYTTLKSIL